MDTISKILTKLTLYSRPIILAALLGTIIVTTVIVIKSLSYIPVYESKPQSVHSAEIYIDRGITVDTTEDVIVKVDIEKKEEHDNNSVLPKDFRYREIDRDKLKLWLKNRNSLFAKDEYFKIIVEAAKAYEINPILLFSILGQEQNFVQADNEFANEMINNPFNVFGSWKAYNTDLQDSAEIASRTIITIFKTFPDGENPFRWLNFKDGSGGYAEDLLWCEGIEFFFNKLSEVVDE